MPATAVVPPTARGTADNAVGSVAAANAVPTATSATNATIAGTCL